VSQIQQERDSLRSQLEKATKSQSNYSQNNNTSYYMPDLRVSRSSSSTSNLSMSPIEERNKLRSELEEATRELARFHKEMDGLSVQLNDMAIEMVS
jgi:hypothetical protein